VGPSSRDEAHCAVIRKLARIIETAEPVLRTAEPSRDVWCGYYLPYEPAAFTGDLPGARELVQEVFTAGDMGLTAAGAAPCYSAWSRTVSVPNTRRMEPPANEPVTVLITDFAGKYSTNYPLLAAAGVLTVIPPAVVALLANRHIRTMLTGSS
jgi:hypothetical protein